MPVLFQEVSQLRVKVKLKPSFCHHFDSAVGGSLSDTGSFAMDES